MNTPSESNRSDFLNSMQIPSAIMEETGSTTRLKTTQDFKMDDINYKSKPVDLRKEKKEINEFLKYLNEDNYAEKLGFGINYIFEDPCQYKNAIEGFSINSYNAEAASEKLDAARQEKYTLQKHHKDLMAEIVSLEVKKIHYLRTLREAHAVPRIIARSSGHPSNSYVHGYGYEYGVGYSNVPKACTAPGFELACTEHVTRLIQKFSPKIGNSSFDELYEEIFDMRPFIPNKHSQHYYYKHHDHYHHCRNLRELPPGTLRARGFSTRVARRNESNKDFAENTETDIG